MTLAFELGKFPHEIEALPLSEITRMMVYADWRNKEDAKAQKGKGRSKSISEAEFNERIKKASESNKPVSTN